MKRVASVLLLAVFCVLSIPEAYARPTDMTPAEWAAERRESARDDKEDVASVETSGTVANTANVPAEYRSSMQNLGLDVDALAITGCRVLDFTGLGIGGYTHIAGPYCVAWALATIDTDPGWIAYCKAGESVPTIYYAPPGWTLTDGWSVCHN